MHGAGWEDPIHPICPILFVPPILPIPPHVTHSDCPMPSHPIPSQASHSSHPLHTPQSQCPVQMCQPSLQPPLSTPSMCTAGTWSCTDAPCPDAAFCPGDLVYVFGSCLRTCDSAEPNGTCTGIADGCVCPPGTVFLVGSPSSAAPSLPGHALGGGVGGTWVLGSWVWGLQPLGSGSGGFSLKEEAGGGLGYWGAGCRGLKELEHWARGWEALGS